MKNPPPPCLHKKFYLFTNAPPKHSPLLAHGCTYGASTRSQELGMLPHTVVLVTQPYAKAFPKADGSRERSEPWSDKARRRRLRRRSILLAAGAEK